eukprot:TRINITY_DN3888_c1_g1_i6.p1 TRINITY_DN3888_c1_g1~~TRINITY_DN3888_c1_g1_i6.p1  ORF type:complete len:707 (+),score=197.57 TRINITY_DN3888_c1_g1_i6:97-2217(+)
MDPDEVAALAKSWGYQRTGRAAAAPPAAQPRASSSPRSPVSPSRGDSQVVVTPKKPPQGFTVAELQRNLASPPLKVPPLGTPAAPQQKQQQQQEKPQFQKMTAFPRCFSDPEHDAAQPARSPPPSPRRQQAPPKQGRERVPLPDPGDDLEVCFSSALGNLVEFRLSEAGGLVTYTVEQKARQPPRRFVYRKSTRRVEFPGTSNRPIVLPLEGLLLRVARLRRLAELAAVEHDFPDSLDLFPDEVAAAQAQPPPPKRSSSADGRREPAAQAAKEPAKKQPAATPPRSASPNRGAPQKPAAKAAAAKAPAAASAQPPAAAASAKAPAAAPAPPVPPLQGPPAPRKQKWDCLTCACLQRLCADCSGARPDELMGARSPMSDPDPDPLGHIPEGLLADAEDGQPPPSAKFEVRAVPGMGMGVVATAPIARGELAIAERPLMSSDLWTDEPCCQPYAPGAPCCPHTEAHEVSIKEQFAQLSEPIQKAALDLAWVPDKTAPGQSTPCSVFYTNALSAMSADGTHAANLFLVCARINHSCRPNVYHSWQDPVERVYAMRDIAAGEQLFMSYRPEAAGANDTAARAKALEFDCGCEVCGLPPDERAKSDENRRRWRALRDEVSDTFQKDPSGALAKCEEILRIVEVETAHAAELASTSHDAYVIATAMGMSDHAVTWARREYEYWKIARGPVDKTTLRARKQAAAIGALPRSSR